MKVLKNITSKIILNSFFKTLMQTELNYRQNNGKIN